jgi:hypothetical protein
MPTLCSFRHGLTVLATKTDRRVVTAPKANDAGECEVTLASQVDPAARANEEIIRQAGMSTFDPKRTFSRRLSRAPREIVANLHGT